ncbi:hypothetical protein ACUN24_09215 [Pedobacter sp. WC2501]|uniref:hypothetical protein n=1 Tax=Pedobacter sp. WC2501 TaxID=3461400 RepID=UPI0040457D85
MKTFYSILYSTIRPNLDEKVSIGLFMGDGERCIFQYSAEKLLIIKDLFSNSAYQNIRTSLKSLSNLAEECSNDHLKSHRSFRIMEVDYFDYLSRYAQNLVTYSPPKSIDIQLTKDNFEKLFEKFVYDLPREIVHKLKPIETARRMLTKSIASHVNFDVELNGSDIPGLVVPAKLWFIGKNEVQVTGESKDFNGVPHFIQQQVNAHLYLIDKIKETPSGKNGHFFFIADEPDKNLHENHKLWKAVRASRLLDIVPTKEIDKVEEYMVRHGVEPLFPSEFQNE